VHLAIHPGNDLLSVVAIPSLPDEPPLARDQILLEIVLVEENGEGSVDAEEKTSRFAVLPGHFYLMACQYEDAPINVWEIPHQRDWHSNVVPRDTEIHESNCLRIAPAFCEVIPKRSPALLG
jgi:hypothetical protein